MMYWNYFLIFAVICILLLVNFFKNSSIRKRMGIKISLIVLLAILFASTLLYIRTNDVTNFGYFITSPSVRYGIIFDAGSTGSRMHVFRFNASSDDPLMVLDDSLFVYAKPGLSSYAQNPKKASEKLKPMLEKAKAYIPEEFWYSTPVALRATAGLRLLPEKTSILILSEVEQLLNQYPFKLVENGVSILEGDDEGLFSWFTVNYLNGKLKNMSETVGVLDLGGGSTQITFYPQPPLTSMDHIVNVTFLGENYQMYTHSYLGLGMMSARFQILGGSERVSGELIPQKLVSSCLPPSYSGSWSYRGQNHEVISSNGSDRFHFCKLKSKEVLDHHDIKKPSSPRFYAISYFFDVALDEKLISDKDEGAEIKIEDFHTLAEHSCQSTNTSKPFNCADLCHISSLLTDGYGIGRKQPITLKKEIRHFEIAWPLGAIFEVFGKFNKIKK